MMFRCDVATVCHAVVVLAAMVPLVAAAAETAPKAPRTLPLWPGGAPEARGTADADRPEITVHLPDPAIATGAAIVVCPGGGYQALMMSYEGHDVAKWLNEHGIAGIVLKYRVKPYELNASMLDGKRAVRYVRANARKWRIDPKRIGMMGFSAGGHLSAAVGTSFDAGIAKATDSIDRVSCRPDFLVLIYPAIDYVGLATDKLVTGRTPPAFLAHSVKDEVVPSEQSARFHAALTAHGVSSEYLELPEGAHGLGCGKGEQWAQWQAACVKWLQARGYARK